MVQAQTDDHIDDPRQHVHMLMAVSVGRDQSRIQEPVQLGGTFPLDILEPDLPLEETFDENPVIRIQFPGPGINQGGDLGRRQYRFGVDQGEVDSHPQFRSPACQSNGVSKSGTGDHDGGRPDQATFHSLGHCPVDQRMPSEIIGIDNQLFGHSSHPFYPGLQQDAGDKCLR